MKAAQIAPSEGEPLRSPGFQPLNRVQTYQKATKCWNEIFGIDCPEVLYPGNLEQCVNSLWAEGAERSSKGLKLRSAAGEYAKEANRLAVCLLNLMYASLGLPEGTFEKFFGWGPETHLEARLNVVRYPICPQPELAFGVVGHTDPSLISLLHQDTVGGLQVRFKDGNWQGVQPLPGAFVIKVGNFLQVCTNGRFVSAKHRVVANKKAKRNSIVYFVLDRMDSVFRPIPELMDAEHPLAYRPFSRGEFLETLTNYGKVADPRLDNAIDLFRHQVPS